MTGAVVTIGNFDGVHRGHQFLLREVVDRARALGLRSLAVTFHPHPEAVLWPDHPIANLTDPDEKVWLMRQFGVDDVWVCPFTRELSTLSAEEFMGLVEQRSPVAELWIGSDFAMGRDRSGTFAVMAALARERLWGLHMVPPHQVDGVIVSSTVIRKHLAAGDVDAAAHLLGRYYAVCGEWEPRAVGGLVRVATDRAVPGAGLYAAQVSQGDAVRRAVASVPTGEAAGEVTVWPLVPAEEPRLGRVSVVFVRQLRPAAPADDRDEPSDHDRVRAEAILADALQFGLEYHPC